MKKILTLALLAVLAMGTAFAQEQNSEKMAERMEKMVARKVKDLKLDDETAAWFADGYPPLCRASAGSAAAAGGKRGENHCGDRCTQEKRRSLCVLLSEWKSAISGD